MTVLTPKRSTETVRYTFDFLKALQGDAIETYTVTVTSGTVTLPAADIVNTGTAIAANVVGGADGVTQTIHVVVNTAASQVLERDYTVLVSDDAIAVFPSTSTKRLLVEVAFEEAGLAGYEFDATPEEHASILRRLRSAYGRVGASQSRPRLRLPRRAGRVGPGGRLRHSGFRSQRRLDLPRAAGLSRHRQDHEPRNGARL
jgi:hypothetical protein